MSPVGCSVFSYYYFDVGNTQAAHGRAPAVAIGHKTANPDSIVVCYQGDGDLASIGLAEIISTAQLGMPMTVIFVNNAIYGMTGGQMAPTTLLGQRTTHLTAAAGPLFAGQPLKVAELIAALDGPVYVERVALYDNRRRVHAKRAIKKALELQVDGDRASRSSRSCPSARSTSTSSPRPPRPGCGTAWKPVFPLGVKKDVDGEGSASRPSRRPPSIPNGRWPRWARRPTAPTGSPTAFPSHLDAG